MLKNYPYLRGVCLVLKKIVQKFDLNEPYTGGIGSYSLFVLLLYAHFKTRHDFSPTDSKIYPAWLLLMFLNHFSTFDFTNYMISYIPTKDMNSDFLVALPWLIGYWSDEKMVLSDPIDSTNNLIAKSFWIEEVFLAFHQTFKDIE